jgi:hypothetical protein
MLPEPGRMPEADIDRGTGRARLTAWTAAIPDGQQPRLGIQQPSALQRQPNSQTARVGKQVFVAEIGIVGREGLRTRLPEAALKPLYPRFASGSNRDITELVQAEREHEFEIGAAIQQRLGDDDISSGRKGAKSNPHLVFG